VRVIGAKYGYSRSHQVILDYGKEDCEILSDKLEKANIIADSGGRLGVSEITRLGMGPNEMQIVGELISLVILNRAKSASIQKKVRGLVSEFHEVKFVLS
jgi:glycine hydroxymethyltransferase